MRFLAIFVFFLGISIVLPKTIEAKLLPQAKSGIKRTVGQTTSTGINVLPRLRNDRRALNITFSNLQNANSVSYNLIYQTSGREEGAGGTVRPSEGQVATRELLFGTCSRNVCRYHTNIANMKLEIISDLKSGKKTLKRYRIRI